MDTLQLDTFTYIQTVTVKDYTFVSACIHTHTHTDIKL